MWHKPCRTFHLWCLCIKTRCLYDLSCHCQSKQKWSLNISSPAVLSTLGQCHALLCPHCPGPLHWQVIDSWHGIDSLTCSSFVFNEFWQPVNTGCQNLLKKKRKMLNSQCSCSTLEEWCTMCITVSWKQFNKWLNGQFHDSLCICYVLIWNKRIVPKFRCWFK